MPDLSRRSLFGTLAAASTGRAASDVRPNTLLVLADDLRWDALGISGHPWVKTPHIDRIGREGVRFDSAFSTTPLDSPARASLLTGQYAHQHDVRGNSENGPLSMKLATFPRAQQRSGYETAFIGKWAMGTEDAPRPGFDRWISFKGQGTYSNPALNLDGKSSPQNGHLDDLLTGHAVDFLRRRKGGKPFSLIVSFKGVQGGGQGQPTPPDRFRSLYLGETARRSPAVADTLDGKPAYRRRPDSPASPRPATDDWVRLQMQTLAAVDEGVGRLLGTLEELGQLDNTLVIFASDHGLFWGEHTFFDKRAPYDEATRIPLLMRYPRLIRANTRLRNYVLAIDLAPTLVEMSRAEPLTLAKGRSLVPLIEGRTRAWRSSFLSEYFEEPNAPRFPSWQSVRTDRWKYIRYPNLEGADELYDLASDPFEMRNLVADAAARLVLADLKEEMARLWREAY